MNPQAVNTPIIGVCIFSALFNSMERGRLRISNAYCNMLLIMIFSFSTGFGDVLHLPHQKAELGMLGSSLFLAARPLKVLYTNRFLPPYVHNAIGSFYLAYHGLSWYRLKSSFEDAGEDADHDF